MARDRRHVHDHAGALFGRYHLGYDIAHHQRGAGEVDADDRVPLILGQLDDFPGGAIFLDQQTVAQDSGVVDEAVEATHRAVGPLDEGTDIRFAADIELAGVDFTWRAFARFGEGGEAFFLDVTDGNLRAGFRQALRKVSAHALSATGDDDLE